jgi:hypothetical protein
MSSLRLVTISLDPKRPDLNTRNWSDSLHDISPNIQHLDHVIHLAGKPNSPKLAVLFARRSSRHVTLICDTLERSFNLKDPSASTRERFEIGLPELCDYDNQCFRDNALDHE